MAVFAAAFGVGFLAATGVAEALTWNHDYPDGSCATSQTVRWRFSNDSSQGPDSHLTTHTWTSSQQTQVDAADDRWDAVKTQTGGTYSDVAKTTSTAASVYKVIHRDLDETSYAGATGCSGSQAVMFLDFTKLNGVLITNDSMQGITAHEFGHTLALNHVGIFDNLYISSKAPTMATGLGSENPPRYPNELKWLEADDWANLALATGSGRPLGGNPSFEQRNLEGWKLESGGSWTLYSSGSAKGSYHVRMTGLNKYILNESRVWGLPNNRDLQVVVWNRDAGSAFAAGKIRIRLWAREVGVAETGIGAFCNVTPDCPNVNKPTVTDNWSQYKYADVWPTSTWDDDYTAWWIDGHDDWVGIDVYVRITNYMTDPDGNSARMYIDDAYVRAL